MADPADKAGDDIEQIENAGIEAARTAAANIPTGQPGQCYNCEEESLRLVGGACARCRDRYGLK